MPAFASACTTFTPCRVRISRSGRVRSWSTGKYPRSKTALPWRVGDASSTGESAAFLAGLTEEKLDQIANMPWAERLSAQFGTVHDSTVAETLMQVPLHSTNHRGQVLTKLREMGGKPPTLDFIAWVWVGKPAAKWPER